MPLRSRAAIQQDADDGKIECRPRPRRGIRPTRGLVDGGPSVLAFEDEVTPTRMKRDFERRIGLQRCCQGSFGRTVEAAEIDTEVWQLVLKPDRQHAVRTVANRPSVQ